MLNVHFYDHENDIAMRNHAFTQVERSYQAAGSIKSFRTPPCPSNHNMGTSRMSAQPQDGVANKWGQTHDIPNLFIRSGSQLTFVSLPIRQADHIAQQMAERAIALLRRKNPMCQDFVKADPIQYEQRSRTMRIKSLLSNIRVENMVGDIPAEMAKEGCITDSPTAKLHQQILIRRGEMPYFASFLRVTSMRYLQRCMQALEKRQSRPAPTLKVPSNAGRSSAFETLSKPPLAEGR